MSVWPAAETRLDPGAINVRLGDGRTAGYLETFASVVLEQIELRNGGLHGTE